MNDWLRTPLMNVRPMTIREWQALLARELRSTWAREQRKRVKRRMTSAAPPSTRRQETGRQLPTHVVR